MAQNFGERFAFLFLWLGGGGGAGGIKFSRFGKFKIL